MYIKKTHAIIICIICFIAFTPFVSFYATCETPELIYNPIADITHLFEPFSLNPDSTVEKLMPRVEMRPLLSDQMSAYLTEKEKSPPAASL